MKGGTRERTKLPLFVKNWIEGQNDRNVCAPRSFTSKKIIVFISSSPLFPSPSWTPLDPDITCKYFKDVQIYKNSWVRTVIVSFTLRYFRYKVSEGSFQISRYQISQRYTKSLFTYYRTLLKQSESSHWYTVCMKRGEKIVCIFSFVQLSAIYDFLSEVIIYAGLSWLFEFSIWLKPSCI